MAKPDWGSKRICQSCGAKFYDLQRNPIVCPACQTTFDPESHLRGRKSRSAAPKPVKPQPAADEDSALEEDILTDGDDIAIGDEVDDDDLDTGDDAIPNVAVEDDKQQD